MKNMRFIAMVMAVIFALALAGCAGQGAASNDQSGSTSGTGAGSAITRAETTTGTGSTITGTETTTGTGASTGASSSITGTGTMTGTETMPGTGAGTQTTFGGWTFYVPNDFTASSGTGTTVASDVYTMTGRFEGNTYVVEIQQADAGSATSLQDWVESDISMSGSTSSSGASTGSGNAVTGTTTMTGTGTTSGAGLSSSNMMTSTVGGFQAVTVSDFMPATNTYNAVCASRTYVWVGGNGTKETGSSTGSSSTITGTGTLTGTGSTSTDGSSSSSMMGSNVIITVYQTSGTCDQQAMQSFVSNFLSQFMAAGAGTGTSSSGMGSSSDTGSSNLGTGTATPTP